MKDYFKETEFIIKLLYFHHNGNRYQGRGIMTWKPDQGFHLEAFLDDRGKGIEKIELGRIGIPSKNDFCSIRMRPQNYDWAIAPEIYLSESDKLEIQVNRRLSINFGRVVFCEPVTPGIDRSIWKGSALYETKSKLSLSDTVCVETRINGQTREINQEPSGLFYEDDQQRKLIGRLIDDRQLKLDWELSKDLWTKTKAWKWNIAIQDVLSIWFGETIWLLKREFRRDAQKITEIRQKVELSTLGLLSPFTGLKFDKKAFIHLADFFIHDPSKAEVCRKIFWQLVEASNQHSQPAQELLLSTILEASLRTIDNHPFTPRKDSSWNVGNGLNNFFGAYLPFKEWEAIHRRVMKENSYLRHRNAHPDWLLSEGGSLSETEQAKSLDSMIFLSRFYGYMILALAGFKDLQPNFLPSHQTWDAPATITVVPNSSSEETLPDFRMLEERLGLKQLHDQLSKAKTYHDRTIILRNFNRDIR
jgi:hypothetical protein